MQRLGSRRIRLRCPKQLPRLLPTRPPACLQGVVDEVCMLHPHSAQGKQGEGR